MQETLFLKDPEDTTCLGRLLGEQLTGQTVIGLFGELGAGKTCFAQGLALGLGVAEETAVASPTFVLAHEYQGRLPFFHLDVYRLEGPEFHETGLDEYFTRPGVTAVEWADKIEPYLPAERIDVILQVVQPSGRQARLITHGAELESILKKVKAMWKQ